MSSLVLLSSKIHCLPHFAAEKTGFLSTRGIKTETQPRPICVQSPHPILLPPHHNHPDVTLTPLAFSRAPAHPTGQRFRAPTHPTTGFAVLAPYILGLVPQTVELGPGGPEEAQPCPSQQLQVPQELQKDSLPGAWSRAHPALCRAPQPGPTCSWARRLRSICSNTAGSSSPKGQARLSCTWGDNMASGLHLALERQCPTSLTCCSAAWSCPRPAGHLKRCWYRAKACFWLQGSPGPPGVAACSMGLGSQGRCPLSPLLCCWSLEKGGPGIRRRQSS